MGVGRSGSTILGVVLGNLQNYFFGGEMHLWIESKGVPTERDYAIEYWKKIADNIPVREQYFNTDFDRQLEFHTALPALFSSHSKPIVTTFHKMSTELFSSIKKVSGCEIVVDSSHYPLRAYWLNKNPALDMHYIYLYRNPVDAIHALMKRDVEQIPKNFLSANLYLFSGQSRCFVKENVYPFRVRLYFVWEWSLIVLIYSSIRSSWLMRVMLFFCNTSFARLR